MGARANKNHAVGLKPVDQQQIPFCVAFPVISPFTLQLMVQPLLGQYTFIGNQQQHRVLEPPHVLLA